jgi:serine/threonine protein kinase
MRGYSTGPLLSQNFFFIMDRLYDTLDKRIKLWRKELHPPGRPGLVRQMLKPNCPSVRRMRQVERDIMMERELVTYDLASAYAYMHENRFVDESLCVALLNPGLDLFHSLCLCGGRLVYRDIKQQNIGFDVRGDVKVFDFGLCRGLSESMRAKDDSTGQPAYGYHLTPRTGEASLVFLRTRMAMSRLAATLDN